MIMCVLLCYPVSIRVYYQQGVLFLVSILFSRAALVYNGLKSQPTQNVPAYDYMPLKLLMIQMICNFTIHYVTFIRKYGKSKTVFQTSFECEPILTMIINGFFFSEQNHVL